MHHPSLWILCASASIGTVGCSGLVDQFDPQSYDVDAVRVLMVRTGADELTGFVPACPGDEINIGVGADQDLVDDSDVSIIDHEGRFAGANPGVVEFTLSPQAVNSGALTDSVPLSDFSTGYALPVEDLAGVGEFYVSTSRTYASARLYEGDLPELGSAWLFEGAGFETVVDVDIDRERDLLVQSAECDASPR